jgi:phosphoglycolate phosphatase-like HAD superfamily hydrolase
MTVLTSIDVDGTMIDSIPEVLKRSREAWQVVDGTEFPMGEENFRRYRWSVSEAKHYFQNAIALQQHKNLPNDYASLDLLRKGYDVPRHVDAFYASRKSAQEKGEEAWLEEHVMFEGVSNMLWALHSGGITNTVITSKDESSTKRLLAHFDLARYVDRVYGKEYGNRTQQFQRLKQDFKEPSVSSVYVYDDLPENLEEAQKHGFKVFLASQGYAKEEDKSRFFALKPKEFSRVVLDGISVGSLV